MTILKTSIILILVRAYYNIPILKSIHIHIGVYTLSILLYKADNIIDM